MSELKRYRRIPLDEIEVVDAKVEKEKETLLNEDTIHEKKQNIQMLINECKNIAIEIEEQLTVNNENPSEWLRAKLWFEVKLKILKDNWWKLRSVDADLSKVGLFLITLSKESMVWRSLGKMSKQNLMKWQEVANHTTIEIIHLRTQTQQRDTKERNIFMKSLRACYNTFSPSLDMSCLH